jgi:hypothetical protein
MKITRIWDMPNSDTFDVPSIGEFVKSYLRKSKMSIDPFARNKRWATITNDLNPSTAAEYHLEAIDFLRKLKSDEVKPDLIIFDPPYSARQVQECYEQVGLAVTMQDTQGKSWSDWKDAIADLCDVGTIVLSFGWNSVGMGIKHKFEIIEILLVCHGGMHNDTICMAERKIAHQFELLEELS